MIVVRMPLKKVLGGRVRLSSWVICSNPAEVQGAVDFVVLQARPLGFEARLCW